MKNLIPLTAFAALVASGITSAQTAVSKPSGYVSQNLAPSSFNLVGIPLMKPTLVSSDVTGVNGADLTDTAVNFTNLLPVGKRMVLEVLTGSAAGTVQDFNTWSGSTITLPSAIPGLAATDEYSIRAAHTLQELFPTGTLVVSGNLNASAADKVWVPIGNGQYIRYFIKGGASNPGWHTTPNGTTIGEVPAITADIPVLYTEGLLVQTGANPITPLVFTGNVKTTPSNVLAQTGQLNLVTTVPPVGLTLFTSGLASQLKVSGNLNAAAADKVWVPIGNGQFIRYFMKGGASNPGWHTTPNGTTIGETLALSVDVPLPPGTYIQRVDASDKVFTFSVPSSYSNL